MLFFSISRPILWEKQTVPPWRKLSLAGVSSFLVSDLLPMLQNIRLPHPTLLLFFCCPSPPWYRFLSHPSLLLPLKSKMAVMIFAKKILNTRSPNYTCSTGYVRQDSNVLCRLERDTFQNFTNTNGTGLLACRR